MSMPAEEEEIKQQAEKIEEQVLGSYKEIRKKMGMEREQARIRKEIIKQRVEAVIKKKRQNSKPAKRPSFDQFHSPLRIFNPNTCLSSSYKSALLGPIFETMGRSLCFANNEDCEAISDPFNKDYSKARTAIAFLKAGASVFGVFLRGVGAGVNYGSNLFSGAITSLLKRKPSNMLTELTGQHYRIIRPTSKQTSPTNKPEENTSLKVLTLNCGLLRDLFWDVGGRKVKGEKLPFNELRPPRERAEELAERIIELDKNNPRDVVCLQEVFDNLAYFGLGKDAQQIMIDKLKSHFPYIVYDVGQRSWPAVGSGLVLLSKHEILEVEYHRYPNLVGLDTTSNKGFLAAKIKKGNEFVTVYTTHTQAGRGGFPTKWLEKLINWVAPVKSPGEVRGEQLGLIEQHRAAWAGKPPRGHETLSHMDTVLTGDINQQLNDANKVLTKSHRKKPRKNRTPGRIKYQGQVDLLKNFEVTLPKNFIDCKIHEAIYVLEMDVLENGKENKKRMKVTIDLDPKPSETEVLSDDFLRKNKEKIKVQEVNAKGEIVNEVGRDLTDNEISKGKVQLLRKGLDPARSEQLKVLIDLEKKRIFEVLRQDPAFKNLSKEILEGMIKEKFEILTGSIMSKASLEYSLEGTEKAAPAEVEVAEPKEVDIAASQKADESNVELVIPTKKPDTDTPGKPLTFSRKKPLITDHAGIMAEFTYGKNKPR